MSTISRSNVTANVTVATAALLNITEYGQIIDLLAGGSTNKYIKTKYSGVDSVLELRQLGGGSIAKFKQNNSLLASINNDGQLVSAIIGSAPFVVGDNTLVSNLNAEFLNSILWSKFLRSDVAGSVLAPFTILKSATGNDFRITGNANNFVWEDSAGLDNLQFNSINSSPTIDIITGKKLQVADAPTVDNDIVRKTEFDAIVKKVVWPTENVGNPSTSTKQGVTVCPVGSKYTLKSWDAFCMDASAATSTSVITCYRNNSSMGTINLLTTDERIVKSLAVNQALSEGDRLHWMLTTDNAHLKICVSYYLEY